MSDLTDIEFFKKDFDQTLFPGIDAAAEGHDGFVDEHAKTASTILAEVKRLISSKNAATVLCVRPHPLVYHCDRVNVCLHRVDWALSWRCSGRARLFVFHHEPAV